MVLVTGKKRKKNEDTPVYPYRGIVLDVDNSDKYSIQYITREMNKERSGELASNKFNSEDLKEAKGMLNTYHILNLKNLGHKMNNK